MRGRLGTIAYFYESEKAPRSSFKVDGTFGSFTFTDTSVRNPTSWEWDFGDGNTSSLQNPTHSYSSSGSFTVGLTVSNSVGSDYSSITLIDYDNIDLWTLRSNVVSGYDLSGSKILDFTLDSWGTDMLIDPNSNDIIIIGNMPGHIKSYNPNGTPTETFSTFENLQTVESSSSRHTKLRNFGGKIYTNAGGYDGGSSGDNQINILNFDGTLYKSIVVNLNRIFDFWVDSGYVYTIGSTPTAYRIEKNNIVSGTPDLTFRSNIQDITGGSGGSNTIFVSGGSIFVTGAFSLYGGLTANRRLKLTTSGTTTLLYGTPNSYLTSFEHSNGIHIWNNSSLGRGISTLNPTTLNIGTYPGVHSSTQIINSFDYDLSGNYYIAGQNWNSTNFEGILKINSAGTIDPDFTYSTSGGIVKVVRLKGGRKE